MSKVILWFTCNQAHMCAHRSAPKYTHASQHKHTHTHILRAMYDTENVAVVEKKLCQKLFQLRIHRLILFDGLLVRSQDPLALSLLCCLRIFFTHWPAEKRLKCLFPNDLCCSFFLTVWWCATDVGERLWVSLQSPSKAAQPHPSHSSTVASALA